MFHGKIEAAAPSRPDAARAARISAAAILALLGAYLLWPILNPVHPEGFTGAVASLGIHLRQDSLTNFDRMQPLNVEFFGLSKLGWVLLTSALTGFGLSASAAMTALTWIAAAVFAIATTALVRRWTGAPIWAIAAVLILFPGVSESAFFFNDNIIASAFAASGLCALYLANRRLGAAMCGALFGAAVLTRMDTVLIGIAVPIILIERERAWRPVVAQLAIAGVLGAIVLFGTLAAFHSTVLDVLTVGRAVFSAWGNVNPARGTIELMYDVGIPGLILVLGGICSVIAKRDWTQAARLLIVPATVFAVLGGQIWEVRQLLPLTPFFVALAVIAVADLTKGERTLRQAIPVGLFAGIVFVFLFGPVTGLISADGPRVLTGRVSNIAHWRGWQSNVDRDFDLMDKLTIVPTGKTRVLISDFWNDDRYLHLVIQEKGYRVVTPTPQCSNIAEQFEKGSSRIVMVRLHQVYVPYWRQLSAERLRRWGLPCIESLKFDDLAIIGPTPRIDYLRGLGVPGEDAKLPQNIFSGRGTMEAAFVDRSELPGLVDGYQKLGEITKDPRRPYVPTIEAAAATARKHTNFGS